MDGVVEEDTHTAMGPGAIRGSKSFYGRVEGISKEPGLSRVGIARPVKLAAYVLVLMMVSGMCLGALSSTSRNQQDVQRATLMYVTHSPILIESESMLTAENGVTSGTGTSADPFVIEGWDIDASTSTAAGIAVSNITSDLVIRDVNVHSGGLDYGAIAAMNVTNITVERSLAIDSAVGITVMDAGKVLIRDNEVVNNTNEGILLYEVNDSQVVHNIAFDSPGIGIALMSCQNCSVTDNAMTMNAQGLSLLSCNDTAASGNAMRFNGVGLAMISTSWSDIHGNLIDSSQTIGVSMVLCENNTLMTNMISNTASDGSMGSGYGVEVMMCSNNTIALNDFVDSWMTPQAYDLASMFGGSGLNFWDLSPPVGGNYWSDYTGTDGDSDGIGDTPYVISTVPLIQDEYPRMAPISYGNEPRAFFIASPASGQVSTTFTFNASPSWDPDNQTVDLEVRWDFDGDKTWDTGWSHSKDATHSYSQAGEYNVTMEIRDHDGHTGNATLHVEVDQVAIPEFATLILPVGLMLAAFLIIAPLARRR